MFCLLSVNPTNLVFISFRFGLNFLFCSTLSTVSAVLNAYATLLTKKNMTLTDKQIEEKLLLYRLNKQKEKKNTPDIFTRIINYCKYLSTILIQYLLPDHINNHEQSCDHNFKKKKLNEVDHEESSNWPKDEKEKVSKSSVPRKKHSFDPDEHQRITDDDENVAGVYSKVDWIVLFLKILLWCILWKLFILMEFGAVFFVCSCFVFIWFHLYSGSHTRKGPSAYSVFNPNCEELLGTYTAEKFEKELLHR